VRIYCFVFSIISIIKIVFIHFWNLIDWLDKTSIVNMSVWTLGDCGGHLFLIILTCLQFNAVCKLGTEYFDSVYVRVCVNVCVCHETPANTVHVINICHKDCL